MLEEKTFRIYDRTARQTTVEKAFCENEALENICKQYQQQNGGNWQAIDISRDTIETDLIAAEFVSAKAQRS